MSILASKHYDRELYVWGSARLGALGIGDLDELPGDPSEPFEKYVETPRWVDLGYNVNVKQVGCGNRHGIVVTDEGDMFVWGCRRYGRTGITTTAGASTDPADLYGDYHAVPVPLPFSQGKVEQVACGSVHSMIVTKDGKAYAWGCARYGRLGIGNFDDLPGDPADPLDKFQPSPVRVSIDAPVVQVACGNWHCMALTSYGDLYAWGSARHGRLGIGNFDDLPSDVVDELDKFSDTPRRVTFDHAERTVRVTQVACSNRHSMVVTSEGDIYGWGCARHGRLGIGMFTDLQSEEGAPEEHYSDIPLCVELDGPKAVQVGCGNRHTVAVTREGEVYAWGYARFGILGIGDSFDTLPADPADEADYYSEDPVRVLLEGAVVVHVKCGALHTVAVTTEGEAISWGCARYGRLGIGNFDDLPSEPGRPNDKYSSVPITAFLPRGTVKTVGPWAAIVWPVPSLGAALPVDLGKLLVSGDFSDVELVADRTVPADLDTLEEHSSLNQPANLDASNFKFRVHRAILGARSPVFAAMLSEHWREGSSSEPISVGCDSAVLQAILSYVYTDVHEPIEDSEYGLRLLQAADMFDLPPLKWQIVQDLREMLSPENVVDIWDGAELANVPTLRATCLRYMRSHYTSCSRIHGFCKAVANRPELTEQLLPLLASAMDESPHDSNPHSALATPRDSDNESESGFGFGRRASGRNQDDEGYPISAFRGEFAFH